MQLTRFPEKAWAGIEILILSESPGAGEKLAERIALLAPEQELRIQVFHRYIEAHDRAKKTKNLGVVLVVEGATGNLPLHDVIRELLAPYESRGIPGAAMLFSEGELTVRGAMSAKKCESCLDYLPISRTENPEALQKLLFNLYLHKQRRFEEKAFPSSTQDLLQSLRGGEEADYQFESRVIELLTAKLNLSWIDAVKARWGATLFQVQKRHPNLLNGLIYEKVVSCERIGEFAKKRSAISPLLTTEMPSFISAFLGALVEAAHEGKFAETLDEWLPDQDTSAFDEPMHRILLREKAAIARIFAEYYESTEKSFWRKTG